MNIYRNPFIVGLWAPAYLVVATSTIITDYLMTAIFIMGTLGLLGAYVTEFPVLTGLYPNEALHKTAISSLMGMLFGLMLFLAFTGLNANEGADSSPMSPQGKFFITWGVMSLPAYPLMVFLIAKLNKRDLQEEHRVREEKKKARKSKGGGPPIMHNKSGF